MNSTNVVTARSTCQADALTLLAEELALARQLKATRKLFELGRRHREDDERRL